MNNERTPTGLMLGKGGGIHVIVTELSPPVALSICGPLLGIPAECASDTILGFQQAYFQMKLEVFCHLHQPSSLTQSDMSTSGLARQCRPRMC